MTVVKTHCGLCLLGVRTRSAMQILIDARTSCALVKSVTVFACYSLLIGANQRMIRCSQFVGKEQIVPNRHNTSMARRTVWCAVLSNE
jgi:hypothetical protein